MANAASRAPRTSRTTASPKKVDLDLDTIERGETPPPFSFKIGGKLLTLTDLDDVEWQEQVAIATTQSPHLFFEATVPEDDQEFFLAQKIPGWKLKILMQGYRDHYGLDEAAAGN